MILYTPLEQSEIFPHKEESSKHQFISYEGRSLYVEQMEDGTYELVQLLSTDPQDFLNMNYTPGTIITKNDSI